MKKISLILFLIPFLISGCNKNEDDHRIQKVTNIDYQTTPFSLLSDVELKIKEEEKNSFFLFIGKENCTICQQAKNNITTGFSNSNAFLYQYNYEDTLVSRNIELIKNLKYTPTFMVVKNGINVYQLVGEEINNENSIKKIVDNYLIPTCQSTLYFDSSLSTYLSSKEHCLVFTYYKKDIYTYSYLSYLENKSLKNDKNILLLDLSFVDNKNNILTTLGVEKEESEYFLLKYENNKLKTTINYLSDDNGFISLVDSYLL